MKKPFTLLLGVVALALGAPPALSAELKLVGVTYPDKKKVEVPFTRTAIAPKAATLTAEVRFQGTQGDIEIEWKQMEPAILFAGNITSYSVWVVTRDGRPENLGELPVRDKKSGDAKYRTGQKNFALIVTAEVLPGTIVPSELVVFQSGAVDPKTTAKSYDFAYDITYPVAGVLRPGNPSIADLTYKAGGEPIELQQARKVAEISDELKAETVEPKAVETAKSQLAQATNAASGRGGSKTTVVDYSRRAIENYGLAIRKTFNKMLQDRMAAEEARRKAEEERKRREMEAAKADAERSKAAAAAAEAEKAKLAAEVDQLKKERESLKQSLVDAAGESMTITETARGVVVNLADILFDVNKYTLKRDSEIALAKVAGILGVFKKFNVRVEGYTDSSGKQELNMTLSSERARSVADFLAKEGVAKDRILHAGYGPANPVADNATKEGRAKNRRVEIILNQEKVEPTPGGVTAPDKPAKATKPAAKPAAAAEPKKQ